MIPMVTTVKDIQQARRHFDETRKALDAEGLPHGQRIRFGAMIETPAAAINAHTLAKEADFFSIGTNDLVQYTCAVDRSNERVAHLYTPSDPAVILLVRDVIRAAKRAKIGCSLCGEMAGEPVYTSLLLGLGLRCFSMAPGNIPQIKQIVRRVTMFTR